MLKRIATANQQLHRREFDADNVVHLLADYPQDARLWEELQKAGNVPLVKLLDDGAQPARKKGRRVAKAGATTPARFQFKHLSFQEGLYAQTLVEVASTWKGWADDDAAAAFLNDSFQQNVCRIGASLLGTGFAKQRATWTFQNIDGHLSPNKLTVNGVAALLPLLDENASIVSLNLAHADIGPDGCATITKVVQGDGGLEQLNLCGSCVGPETACLLAGALRSNARLRWLCLAMNGLSPEVSLAFARTLRVNQTLEFLDLSDNDLRHDSCHALIDSCAHNSTLETLLLKNVGHLRPSSSSDPSDQVAKAQQDAFLQLCETVAKAKPGLRLELESASVRMTWN